MKYYNIDYSSFKSIVYSGPYFFHWFEIPSENRIEIVSQRDQMVTVITSISNDVTDPENIDFATWSWMAGDWDYKKKSWVLNYGLGVTEHEWQFVADSGNNASAMLKQGHLIIKNFDDEDRFLFDVYDKDGIYAPAGYVFRTFVDIHAVNERENALAPYVKIPIDPKSFDVPSRSKILSGLWLRLRLVRNGVSTPKAFPYLEYEYKEQPS